MVDVAKLRRYISKEEYLEIKNLQKILNRFKVARALDLSLVTVRFAYMSNSFEEFKYLQKEGLKQLGSSNSYGLAKRADAQANDPLYKQQRWNQEYKKIPLEQEVVE